MNSRKEVRGSPGEEKSGGKQLEMFDLDFVSWVIVLHNRCKRTR